MLEREKIIKFLKANEAENKLSQAGKALEYVINKIESGEFDVVDDWEKRFEIAFENNVRYINENKQSEKHNKSLKKQVKEYERILKWYANDQHYHIYDHHGYLAVQNDEGLQARNILRRWNER